MSVSAIPLPTALNSYLLTLLPSNLLIMPFCFSCTVENLFSVFHHERLHVSNLRCLLINVKIQFRADLDIYPLKTSGYFQHPGRWFNLVLGFQVIKTIAFQNMKLHCFYKYAFSYYTHCS